MGDLVFEAYPRIVVRMWRALRRGCPRCRSRFPKTTGNAHPTGRWRDTRYSGEEQILDSEYRCGVCAHTWIEPGGAWDI
jgi:hypothetical protein